MKNKRLLIYSGGILAIIVVFLLVISVGRDSATPSNRNAVVEPQVQQVTSQQVIPQQDTSLAASSQPQSSSSAQNFSKKDINSESSVKIPQNIETKSIEVTLIVSNTVYKTSVPEGSSIYGAMNTIASTASFRFSATHFSSLGYLINQINGVTNSNGTYWTLYVNGAYSMVGASQYILKNGDVVEWKFEKK